VNDPAIRALLYPLLADGVHIDELPTGSTRADVVHITEHFMHGYEVKGDRDTLQRVPNQLRCYAEKHLPKLLPLLPEWVGVLVAAPSGLRPHRAAAYNATVERAPVAALLLLEEVKQFLLALGLTGVSTLRGRDVAHLLRTNHRIPLAGLAHYARQRLMARLPQRLLARAGRKAERDRLAAIRQRRPNRPARGPKPPAGKPA